MQKSVLSGKALSNSLFHFEKTSIKGSSTWPGCFVLLCVNMLLFCKFLCYTENVQGHIFSRLDVSLQSSVFANSMALESQYIYPGLDCQIYQKSTL